MKTWFIDIDGTILEHRENKEIFEGSKEVLLPGSKEFIDERYSNGDVIILTTARPHETHSITVKVLKEFGIRYDEILFDLGHRERIVVNDIKPVNSEDGGDRYEPMVTAYALNVKRNEGLENHRYYLKDRY